MGEGKLEHVNVTVTDPDAVARLRGLYEAIGALVEATHHEFPSVVVECGRSGDPAADRVARMATVIETC